MILGVLVRTVLRWSGATCRIALSFHFRLLAPGVGARSLASRWLNLCLLPAWNWIALDDFFLLVTLGAMRAIAAVKPRPPSHVGRVPPLRSAERVSSGAARGSRLPNGGEGRRDQQLVFLADRTDPGLCRPCATGAAGFLADAGALVQVLVDPDVDEFVERAELARPAGRQGGELLPSLDRLAPRLQHLRDVARGVGIGAHLVHVAGAVIAAAQRAHERRRVHDLGVLGHDQVLPA